VNSLCQFSQMMPFAPGKSSTFLLS
jgi:hypothetical protein